MKKILSFFREWYYQRKMEIQMEGLPVFEYLDTLKKYDKFEAGNAVIEKFIIPCQAWIYAVKDKNEEVFDVFYENIRMHILNTDKNKTVQIFLKKKDDSWVVSKKGNTYDFSNPDNKSIEIYRWFDVEYMGDSRFSDEKYLKGNWNEMVSKNLSELDRIIKGFTDFTQVNESYKPDGKLDNKDCEKITEEETENTK